MPTARIESVFTYVPDTALRNPELAERWDSWSAEEIEEKTGIRERRIAGPEECSSDLAAAAAERLFASHPDSRQEIDYVLFCTQTPDHFLPATACLLQERLGLSRATGAIDFNQGCSGYVVGLSLAKGLIESSQAKSVLLLTGETYSKLVHPLDRTVATLFGDAGSATLITASASEPGLGNFVFGTDGRGAGSLIVPAGAFRSPPSGETCIETEDGKGNVRSEQNLFMDGPEIFRFAITAVPRTVRNLLKKAELSLDDVDFLVLHQANKFMLDHVVKRLRIDPEKCPYEFAMYGNTVSCSIPLVLNDLNAKGCLARGQRLILVGFGVGYSWAACDVTW